MQEKKQERGLSLAAALLIVGLVAVDLSVLRYHYSEPDYSAPRACWNLTLSLLLPANLLALLGYRLMRAKAKQSSPFAVGFFIFGLAALSLHVLLDRSLGGAAEYYAFLARPYNKFCLRHLPYPIFTTGVGPESTAWSTYYPALSLAFSLPQFLISLAGGLLLRCYGARRIPLADA